MRIHTQIFKCASLTALFIAGFAAGSFAQNTTTIDDPEKKAPVVVSTTPSGSEGNVDQRSVIEIIFSTEMDKETINNSTLLLYASSSDGVQEDQDEYQNDRLREHSLYQNSDYNRQNTSGTVNGTISYSDKVAVFTPSEDLKEGTSYTFTVTNGIKSSDNIALENNHEWSFTTKGNDSATTSGNLDYRRVQNNYDRDQENQIERADRSFETNRSGLDRNEYSENSLNSPRNGNVNKIELGKAGQFVMLAKSDIHNESGSDITGQTGDGSLSEKKNKETAFADSVKQTRTDHVAVWQRNQDDTTSTEVSEAMEDMMSAYSDASMQNGDDSSGVENERFQSSVLTPGVHQWNDSLHIESEITLSGNENDVWVFKIGDNLTVHENTVITLTDGAHAENIFWFVEGEVTVGENAQFEGIILSMNDITLEKGAKINGRMFSQASITLNDNTITEPRTLTAQTSSTNR